MGNDTNYWNGYWKFLAEGRNVDNKSVDMWLDDYSDIISKIPSGKVLELGCGLGQFSKYFMEKGFDVLATDISPDALAKAAKNVDSLKTQVLDMGKPFPFGDNIFDIVMANLSIHYFDEATTHRILSEILRVLSPNGYFIGSVISANDKRRERGREVEIEPNYIKRQGGENLRIVRYFDENSFDTFFKDFTFEMLEEKTRTRVGVPKTAWEFIVRPK